MSKVKQKWYYKCKKCGKPIKRKIKKNLICNDCKKILKTKECIHCKIRFIPKPKTQKYCSTSCSSKHILTGRTLSKSHRESLSKAATLTTSGFTQCKFYKIYNSYLKRDISVQGTYELKYAKYLNDNNIKWDRGKHINLPYVTDIHRIYYPDFYLIDSDEYIEIKGYFFESDKIKMNHVITQYPEKYIKILFKDDLNILGIDF